MSLNFPPAFYVLARRCCLLACLLLPTIVSWGQTDTNQPNILLVIADDLGVDVSNGYHTGNLMPTTPTLDSLRAVGITFENVFAAPKCTPSRATIMSGKYGVKTGVIGTPGTLDLTHNSIFKAVAEQTDNAYADAVVGKWHLVSPTDPDHPLDHGADYYMGTLSAGVEDYYAWDKTENGETTLDTTYATTAFTNAAIDWVAAQQQSWFLWLAHVAPHSPLHEPPSFMYTVGNPTNNYRKYLAMIEAMDYDLNRLLATLPMEVRENTLVIYLGDNGTPNNLLQDYPTGHGKSTIYQGGIRVPMIIAGPGVSRQGARESALVHINDLYATILEYTGSELPGGINNSLSFAHLLDGSPGPTRDYNYSEIGQEADNNGWTIRGPQYKLIQFTNGTQEFYDLLSDSLEFDNLLAGTLDAEQLLIKADLEVEAAQIRTGWSCRDHIQNGDETGIDCGGSSCTPCTTTGLAEYNRSTGIIVSPNPAQEILNIQAVEGQIEALRVFNTLGELLLEQENINQATTTISITHLKPQLLWVQVRKDGANQLMKVVKR